MKFLIPLILLVFTFTTSAAQYWHWAKDTQGLRAQKVASDGISNLYVHGSYEGSLNIGPHNISTATADGIFLAKYDTSGNVLWAKDISIPNRLSFANDIALDASGNVYVTGAVHNTGSNADNYVMKFDSAGNKVWENIQSIGINSFQINNYTEYGYYERYKLAVSKDGNAYVSGVVTTSFTYNGNTYTKSTPAAACVLKINASGAAEWFTVYEVDEGQFAPSDIAVGSDGNPVICGNTESLRPTKFLFDNFTLPIVIKGNRIPPGTICYIVKLQKGEGKPLWGKASMSISSSSHTPNEYATSYASAIAIDSKNDIYVNGFFNNDIVIDNVTLTESNPGQYNGANYIAKFSEGGDVKWIRKTYDQNANYFGKHYQLSINTNDDIFICNTFTDFLNTIYHEYTISRLDTAGKVLWNESVLCGVGVFPDVSSICTDAAHNVYVAGTLEGGPAPPTSNNQAIKLGTFTIPVPTSYRHNEYLAKLAPERLSSVDNIKAHKTLNIYPNPARDYLTVSFEQEGKHSYSVLITDMVGKTLFATEAVTQHTRIDIKNLQAGSYIVQLKVDDQIAETSKFIVN